MLNVGTTKLWVIYFKKKFVLCYIIINLKTIETYLGSQFGLELQKTIHFQKFNYFLLFCHSFNKKSNKNITKIRERKY